MKARKEKKYTVLALAEKGRHGLWFVIHSKDMEVTFAGIFEGEYE